MAKDLSAMIDFLTPDSNYLAWIYLREGEAPVIAGFVYGGKFKMEGDARLLTLNPRFYVKLESTVRPIWPRLATELETDKGWVFLCEPVSADCDSFLRATVFFPSGRTV